MTDSPAPPPPNAADAPPSQPAPPRATHREKLPLYLILGGIGVFLAFVLWSVRDNQSAADLSVGTCLDLRPGRTTRSCRSP